MAFTFTNYAGIQPQQSPLHDMIGQILSGYNDTTRAQFLRPGLEEQLKKAQQENQWYGPNMQSQIGLRGAQAGHLGSLTTGQNITNKFLPQTLQSQLDASQFKANNPLLGMTGGAGQIGALLYLKQHPELMGEQQQGGFGQPNANDLASLAQSQGQSYMPSIGQQQQPQMGGQQMPNAQDLLRQSIMASLKPKQKQFAPSNILKLQNELKDIESGVYPGTDEKIPSKQMQEELAAPYREHLGGLEKGAHYIYDPETHEKIGQERPYTEKERETEKGRALFNEVFPDINNAFKDFIGKDSVKNFFKYANEYGRNPEATRKIDDLLLGQELITAAVVNEAATLGAGKTNQTYKNLAKSFPGSDIPNLIERYGKEFKLPSEAFVKAGVRFQNKINQASERASNSIPALKKVYFHPEKYLKTEEAQKANLEHHEETITIKNKKTGKEETVSLAEARKRGIKNV
jgi:hypothetical protein